MRNRRPLGRRFAFQGSPAWREPAFLALEIFIQKSQEQASRSTRFP
jgi:hypothetical protein